MQKKGLVLYAPWLLAASLAVKASIPILADVFKRPCCLCRFI